MIESTRRLKKTLAGLIRLKKVPEGQIRVWISEGLRRFKNKGSKRLKKVSRRFKNKGC